MGFPSLLTIIFVFLRAFEVVTWSWWVVFSPIIISLTFWIVLFFIALIAEKRA
uniref:transmembrane Fragile-X-F protein n=1 Tax=uncultured Allobacillus sp. TaxID=1638025 RepID=UPI002599F158|nr:transmembrane Fragile-X-F protein [uncultured Allobacillus sp.]